MLKNMKIIGALYFSANKFRSSYNVLDPSFQSHVQSFIFTTSYFVIQIERSKSKSKLMNVLIRVMLYSYFDVVLFNFRFW